MLILFRVALIITLLIVLIKLRLNLAIALLLNAIAAGILFRLDFLSIIKAFPLTLIQPTTLEFLLIVYLVLLLGNILEEFGSLNKMIPALENLFRDYRLSLALMPALIGLLPMPAGAMFSAPIIKKIGEKPELSPEIMTHINYWFRHLWEYCWPLYPSLLLAAGIFNVPIRSIMINQFPLSLFAILAGLFFINRLPRMDNEAQPKFKDVLTIILGMWPIILVIILVLVFNLRMVWALIIGSMGAILFSRRHLKEIFTVAKKTFSISTLGVIYAVFLFKNIMETSGAFTAIPEVAKGLPFLQIIIIFLAPFLVGFLTGVNSAFVGITFPVLIPFMVNHGSILRFVMLAYIGGFAGVLLSPVHLCLCMTKEYYGADFPKVYRYVIPSVLFVIAGAVIVFLAKV